MKVQSQLQAILKFDSHPGGSRWRPSFWRRLGRHLLRNVLPVIIMTLVLAGASLLAAGRIDQAKAAPHLELISASRQPVPAGISGGDELRGAADLVGVALD